MNATEFWVLCKLKNKEDSKLSNVPGTKMDIFFHIICQHLDINQLKFQFLSSSLQGTNGLINFISLFEEIIIKAQHCGTSSFEFRKRILD